MASADINVHTPMAKSSSRFLLGYLLAAMALALYVVCSLWSAQPRAATGRVPTPACTVGASGLANLYPEWVNVGSAAPDILILGCGFAATTQVKFNGAPHPALFVDAGHIRAALTGTDVATAGNVVVTLSNGGVDFGSGVLTVAPAIVTWQPFGSSPQPISQELQLLFMVLFTGAFGSCVYALKSLANYQGDNKLYETWFVYYLVRPFEGAGIAFLLYLVIRGGFMSGSAGDKAVNQFSICAVAGLAGTFTDIAFLKLREVFQVLFKPQDDRGGKLTIKIGTTGLPAGAVGVPYKQTLAATSGTAPFQWAVTPELPHDLTLDSATGLISGTPKEASKASYKFTVTDSATPPASMARK